MNLQFSRFNNHSQVQRHTSLQVNSLPCSALCQITREVTTELVGLKMSPKRLTQSYGHEPPEMYLDFSLCSHEDRAKIEKARSIFSLSFGTGQRFILLSGDLRTPRSHIDLLQFRTLGGLHNPQLLSETRLSVTVFCKLCHTSNVDADPEVCMRVAHSRRQSR